MQGLHKHVWGASPHLLMSLLLALTTASLASITVEEAGLRIIFPNTTTQRMDFAMADFGEAKYGGTLQGDLYYPTSDLENLPAGQDAIKCFPEDCQYACQPYAASMPLPYSTPQTKGRFNIMLVDRGPAGTTNCYFMNKAWNAQQAGAHAVIIVDYSDDGLSVLTVPDKEEYAKVLPNLTIAVGMISKSDGQVLKDLLKSAPVMVSLNWTNIVPRAKTVTWELFTNSNDECGTICKEQKTFVKTFRETAISMELAGLTSFTPHYIIWSCPIDYVDSIDCKSQCIFNGTYCAYDPDQDYTIGYTGVDVLMMNIRQLCFFKLAKEVGKPWMWWDYVDQFGDKCKMSDKLYTADCAKEVFLSSWQAENLTLSSQAWDACIVNSSEASGPNSTTTTHAMLEEDMLAQAGTVDEPSVTILPTVRINGEQYRGNMDKAGVMRAICSAFTLGQEPALCLEKWVSEDECDAAVNGVGIKACQVSESRLLKKPTRCVNTFESYKCDCGGSYVKSVDHKTGGEVCQDLNECLATSIPLTNPDCSCDRCACVNLVGSYNCTGELPNMCNREHKWGGCWSDTTSHTDPPSKDPVTNACYDHFKTHRDSFARGDAASIDSYWSCVCPGGCWKGDGRAGGTGCTLDCHSAGCHMDPDGFKYCAAEWKDHPQMNPAWTWQGGEQKSGPTFSSFVVTLLVLAAVAVLAVAGYKHVYKKQQDQRLQGMLSQYMPVEQLGMSDYQPPVPIIDSGNEMQRLVDTQQSHAKNIDIP